MGPFATAASPAYRLTLQLIRKGPSSSSFFLPLHSTPSTGPCLLVRPPLFSPPYVSAIIFRRGPFVSARMGLQGTNGRKKGEKDPSSLRSPSLFHVRLASFCWLKCQSRSLSIRDRRGSNFRLLVQQCTHSGKSIFSLSVRTKSGWYRMAILYPPPQPTDTVQTLIPERPAFTWGVMHGSFASSCAVKPDA